MTINTNFTNNFLLFLRIVSIQDRFKNDVADDV